MHFALQSDRFLLRAVIHAVGFRAVRNYTESLYYVTFRSEIIHFLITCTKDLLADDVIAG